MSEVFLSYRRIDVGLALATRVFDLLTENLGAGMVFLDSTMAIGSEWPSEIEEAVRRCSVFVALIGPNWTAPGLDDPEDWTRKEVAIALARRISFLPLFLDGGKPPLLTEVPGEIADISLKQGYYIDTRTYEVFRAAVGAIGAHIASLVGLQPLIEKSKQSCEVIIVRDPPEKQVLKNDWILKIDGISVLRLDRDDVFKSVRVEPGTHTLTIEWDWEASYPGPPQGGNPREYWYGESVPLTTEFVSGRYQFTLLSLQQGFWRSLLGEKPRRIIVDATALPRPG
jgi:hypothetical protein